MNHQVAFRDDYLDTIDGLARFFTSYGDKKNEDTYFVDINSVGGLREYGITPTRVKKMSERIKIAAELMDMKFIKSLTDSRWEASRDGLHWFGNCKTGGGNACGGVVKAKGIVLLHSIFINQLNKSGKDLQKSIDDLVEERRIKSITDIEGDELENESGSD